MIVHGTLAVRMEPLKAVFFSSAERKMTMDTNKVKGGGFREILILRERSFYLKKMIFVS